MNDAAQEDSLLREALDRIIEIRNIRNERRIQVNLVCLFSNFAITRYFV